MARSSLLATRALSYLELIGNGREFEVPRYQRDYSWTELQWEDLWEDIQRLAEKTDERHYLGTIVLRSTSDRTFEIIDGQQRLATLAIFALSVIRTLSLLAESGVDGSDNEERAQGLRNRFIGEKHLGSLQEVSKLRLNSTNDGFFRDHIVQLRPPTNIRGEKKTNRLLWACYEWFLGKLAEDSVPKKGETLANLLVESAARGLYFIEIVVDDEVNAYTVFETLNARGLELSTTDLMKNYLFSKIQSASDLESLEGRWQRLTATVKAEKFPEFLRFHYLCEMSQVRTERLYKLVRDKVTSPTQTFALLDVLERRAEIYAALFDPVHEYWKEIPGARQIVEELLLFGTRAMTPVLLAGWEKLDKGPEFVRLLQLVSVLMFRFTVVGELNTHRLEPASHRCAKAILAGQAKSVREIFGLLRDIYVEDAKFIRDFASMELTTSGGGKKIARYILAKLEADASGGECDHRTAGFTLEHILPESPGSEWAHWADTPRTQAAAARLGNLLPLEPGLNREVGNADFGHKVQQYAASSYALARAVAQDAPSEWNIESIERRQDRLAKRAAHIWRSPFV